MMTLERKSLSLARYSLGGTSSCDEHLAPSCPQDIHRSGVSLTRIQTAQAGASGGRRSTALIRIRVSSRFEPRAGSKGDVLEGPKGHGLRCPRPVTECRAGWGKGEVCDPRQLPQTLRLSCRAI